MAPRRSGHRWTTIRAWKGAAFTAPFFLGFIALFLLPFGYAVYQSFFTEKSSGLGLGPKTIEFAGFDNFAKGLSDAKFWTAMGRVLVFACVQIPVMLAISLAMALMLDAVRRRLAGAFRFAFLIPHMIPGIVAALMWIYLYSPNVGPFTELGDKLGLDVDFFSADMIWLSMGNLLTWGGVGFNMLIIYGALLAIPREIFDAARVDGASEFRIAISIKVPFVRSALVLTGMLSIIGMLQIFNEPVLFRQFTPETVNKDFTPILMIFYQAFSSDNYHYAAALSVILAFVMGLVSFLFYKFTNRAHP